MGRGSRASEIAPVVAGVFHALLGVFMVAGILVIPSMTVWVGTLVAWVAAIPLMVRWREYPNRVTFVPIVLFLGWCVVLGIWGCWQSPPGDPKRCLV